MRIPPLKNAPLDSTLTTGVMGGGAVLRRSLEPFRINIFITMISGAADTKSKGPRRRAAAGRVQNANKNPVG